MTLTGVVNYFLNSANLNKNLLQWHPSHFFGYPIFSAFFLWEININIQVNYKRITPQFLRTGINSCEHFMVKVKKKGGTVSTYGTYSNDQMRVGPLYYLY